MMDMDMPHVYTGGFADDADANAEDVDSSDTQQQRRPSTANAAISHPTGQTQTKLQVQHRRSSTSGVDSSSHSHTNPNGPTTLSRTPTFPSESFTTSRNPLLSYLHHANASGASGSPGGGYSTNPYGTTTTNTSARTSYTRVEQSGIISDMDVDMDNSERERRDRERGDDDDERSDDGSGSGSGDEPLSLGLREREEPPIIPQTPQTSLCFLLISGRRRVMSFDPDTTIGRVKELVWNAWPGDTDWQDERPPTPSHLRILHLGKILQDEDTLKTLGFPHSSPPPPPPPHTTSSLDPSAPAPTTSPTPAAAPTPAVIPPPTIVHLAIRPSGTPLPSDDMKKKRRSVLVARLSSLRSVGAVGVGVGVVSPTPRAPPNVNSPSAAAAGAGEAGRGEVGVGRGTGGVGGDGEEGEEHGERTNSRVFGCCVIS